MSISNADTEKQVSYGLLGRTLAHSWSAPIHRQLGSFPYELIELEPDEVAPFIREGRWSGLNVTIPYKADAARLADVASERVESLGVANTLVHLSDGRIYADNTDVLGFSWMLERFCQERLGGSASELLKGREVCVLGDGGASAAVACALRSANAKVAIISRHTSDNYLHLAENHPKAMLLVNTTPVGMYPNCPASVVDEHLLRSLTELEGVLDVVYNPARTGISLIAECLGIPAETGLAMLVGQAFFSSELFQDRTLDRNLIVSITADLAKQTQNVIYIGMPGAGKTTAGRCLARLLGRPFVDLDEALLVDLGIDAASYIKEQGEDAFRDLETLVARRYGSRSGLVIACGGGIVCRKRNYEFLHQNGTIIWLKRPLDQLSSFGRPMSQAKGVVQIAQEREGLYEAWSDCSIECTGSAQGDARKTAELLGYTY